jgi:hypothetical protein
VASWLFFCVAHSSRINSDMLVVRALKNSQLIRPLPDESHVIYGTGHYGPSIEIELRSERIILQSYIANNLQEAGLAAILVT